MSVLAGDMLLYWVERHFGRQILKWHTVRRMLTPAREARVMDAYHRHGLKFVVMARLVMGLRAAAFLTAGLVRVRAFLVVAPWLPGFLRSKPFIRQQLLLCLRVIRVLLIVKKKNWKMFSNHYQGKLLMWCFQAHLIFPAML